MDDNLIVLNIVFDQYQHASSVLVSVCAVGDVARDVESRCGGEFCFVDGCYVYVVVVEEQGEFAFLLVRALAFQVMMRKLCFI